MLKLCKHRHDFVRLTAGVPTAYAVSQKLTDGPCIYCTALLRRRV